MGIFGSTITELGPSEIAQIRFRDTIRPRHLYAIGGWLVGGVAAVLIADAAGEEGIGIGVAGFLGGIVGAATGLVLPIDIPYERQVTCP